MIMAEFVIEELSAISECAVCLSSATKPKVLPCLHMFCLACLQGVYAQAIKRTPTTMGQLTCPACNAVSPILAGDLTQLPSDFRSNQLAAALENFQKATSTSNCFSCSKNKLWTVAQVLCFDCAKAFCTNCHNKHSVNKRFNNHVHTILIEDGIDDLLCSEHSEFFHMYCLECTKGICQVCMLTSHADHTIEAFAPSHGATSSLQVGSMQAEGRLKKLQSQNSDILKEYRHHVQTVKDDIRKNKMQLIKKLDDEERALVAKLDIECKDFELISDGMTRDLHSKLTKLGELVNKAQIIHRPLPRATDIKLAVTDFPSSEYTEIKRASCDLTLPTAPKYRYIESKDGMGTFDEIKTSSKADHRPGETSDKKSKQDDVETPHPAGFVRIPNLLDQTWASPAQTTQDEGEKSAGARKQDVAVVMMVHTAKRPQELTLRVGEHVRILKRQDHRWWIGQLLSGPDREPIRLGCFPAYCVRELSADDSVDQLTKTSPAQRAHDE